MNKWTYQKIELAHNLKANSGGDGIKFGLRSLYMFSNKDTGEVKLFDTDIVEKLGINNIELELKRKKKL